MTHGDLVFMLKLEKMIVLGKIMRCASVLDHSKRDLEECGQMIDQFKEDYCMFLKLSFHDDANKKATYNMFQLLKGADANGTLYCSNTRGSIDNVDENFLLKEDQSDSVNHCYGTEFHKYAFMSILIEPHRLYQGLSL